MKKILSVFGIRIILSLFLIGCFLIGCETIPQEELSEDELIAEAELSAKEERAKTEPRIGPDDFTILNTKIKVYDENQQPLENAKVMALHEKYHYMFPFDEGGRVNPGITNNNGEYTIRTIPGEYSLFLWKYDEGQSKSYIASLEGIQLGEGDVSVNIDNIRQYSFPDLGLIQGYSIVGYSQRYGTQMRSLDDMGIGYFSSPTLQLYTNNEMINMAFLFSGFAPSNYDKYFVAFNQDQNSISFSELNDVYIKTSNSDPSIEETIHYNTVGNYAFFNDMSVIRNNEQHIYTNVEKIKINYVIRKGQTGLNLVRKGSNVIDTSEVDGQEINYGTIFSYDFNAVNETYNDNGVIEKRTSVYTVIRDEFGNFVSGNLENKPDTHMDVEIYNLNDKLIDSHELWQFWTQLHLEPRDHYNGIQYYDPNNYKIKIRVDLDDFGSGEIYTRLNDPELYFEPAWYETDTMEFKLLPMFDDENQLFMDSVLELQDIGIQQFGIPPENPCGKIQFAIHWGWDKPECRSVTGLMSGPEYIGATLYDPFSLGVPSHELGHAFTINFCFPRHFHCLGNPSQEPTGWPEAIATTFGRGAIIELYGQEGDDRGETNALTRVIYGELAFEEDINDILQSIHYIIWEEYGYDVFTTLIKEWDNGLKPKRQILFDRGFTYDEIIVIILSSMTGDNLGWLFELGGFDVTYERVEQGLTLI